MPDFRKIVRVNLKSLVVRVRYRVRYTLDPQYRIDCIAEEVAQRLEPRLMQSAADHLGKRVAAAMEASLRD